MRRLATSCLLVSGLTGLAVLTAPVTPASAATGAMGQCYGEMRAAATGAFSGWCDGPATHAYRAYVNCSDHRSATGGWHWFGDRRGSLAVCASGASGTGAGFQIRTFG